MFLVRICPTFSVDLFVHLLPPCSSGRHKFTLKFLCLTGHYISYIRDPSEDTWLPEEAAGRSTLGQTAICFMSSHNILDFNIKS